MRNSNTNNWRSTALIAGAILTAGVVTTTSTTDVHADNSQNNAQVSNDQVTYDQVRATADQQLAQLQSANDSKEAQQATANEQSNAADLAQTNAQIDQLKASHAAREQEQAGAIAQAQASTAASIEEQTSAANAEYQQQINAQQQNEAIQRAANDQQYAQAVSQAAENQQAVADINAQYQQALSDAANTQTSQAQAAANNYNSAVAKENDTYQGKLSAQQATNAENVKNAEASLATATANANKPYEVATTNEVAVTGRVAKPQTDVKVPDYVAKYGIHLEVRGYNGAIPVSDYTYPEFANTYYGEYPDSVVITNKAAESTPHDISEMPLDFQPGLLSYDAKNDHSEKVSADGLTAAQVQVLRALALSWENGFRNNVFQNYREFYNAVNKNDGFVNVAPVDLVSTDFTDDIANQVVANRTKYNVDNNSHTVKDSGMPTEATYSSIINNVTQNLQKNLTSEFNGKTVYTDVNENLTTMQAGTPTLLNYAINLYNSMQGMYYGELVNPTHIGGHAVNLLRAGVRTVGIGFQKLTDEMTGKSGSGVSDRKNPSYAVTFDHVGFNIDHDANLTKEVQNRNVWGTSTVDAQLNTIKTAQYHVNKVPGTKTVTPTATDVQKATASEQQKLADAKAQAQQSLDALASAHQASLNKLEQQYNDVKAQIKANYDAAVTKATSVRDAALKATGAVDLQAYKAQLDSAYQNLVKADQVAAQKLAADRDAKIANIKKTENAKLNAKINELVPSIDPQIKQLQDQHQAVIAHGDAVLAELKAENKAAYNKLAEQFNVQLAAIQQREDAKRANEVRLANNTVVLPTAVKAANDGNVDTVAFPTVTNRLQAETTGRVQPVSAPSIVKTATQTPIAVAPVVTQTAAVAATTNNGTQTPVASTADNKATKADNNEKSVVKADTVAKKQAPAKKSESSQKVDRSSMSIVALAATALLGTLGITYSSKKRHN
ncbi:hypothetical protein [Limosilactobacillus reuteri]|uniref:Uncharacterized protein n=1 Tax=Limosilactobacillus reuteri TaxID=1598 RepID=A0A256VK82_LIMRT|nr:hypothetical protein [Limosilactobacillus reuteri]OYS60064.1 hypothetical protein CBF88_04235 [Limosilactobacillus reuteri]OYS61566.1 hypothetical protein CBF91_05010 [Limosilactobacillus reuteri]OYS64728.1 hypothetical protein CBF89_04730 [Limosilactobacillus reuteri]OYS72844.1 hypothetical protein CBG01_04550 [Limosilactobacillus reuteri]OYS75333.1 hypothetical protein CBG08_04750 [Limosilactobacillus reuteri]